MPELPEIETIYRSLAPTLENQVLQGIHIYCTQLRYPVDQQLKTVLKQKRVICLSRRGKYLLFHFRQGGLICHLGMSGSLRLVSSETALKKHDHFDLEFKTHLLRFNDPRRFGLLLVTDNFSTHPLLQHLGPEPLDPTFSAEYLQQKLRHKKTTIKQAIMDNHIVVGVGNIYANEALFRAGIIPLQPAKQLHTQQCKELVKAIKTTLNRAIDAGGTSLKDFVDSNGRPGYFQQQLFVYARTGQSCRWCKHQIVATQLGGRNTFYCPNCQS